MTPEQYAHFPNELTVREIKVAHRVLVTTLLEHRQVSKDDLSTLYARRWNVELDLRNLKTTMGMDVLSCQTPQMNEKQLWVHLLAYNLIRLLMAQAARKAGIDPRTLSFKHTVQLWTEWVSRGLSATKDCGLLFRLIAQCSVGNRPGRIEPRMRKRRPKPYPWLKVPACPRAPKNQDPWSRLGDKVSAIRFKAALHRQLCRFTGSKTAQFVEHLNIVHRVKVIQGGFNLCQSDNVVCVCHQQRGLFTAEPVRRQKIHRFMPYQALRLWQVMGRL